MNTVVVTGPTGHLGLAIVTRLLRDFNVIGISRTASSVNFDEYLSGDNLGKYTPIDQDLTTFSDEVIASLVDSYVRDAKSSLVGLVNNAFTDYPALLCL